MCLNSSFSSGSPDKSSDETINIFSVASGHLYERFLRIMMLTVLKNTKSPVKFWFLKNYLSPTLKVFNYIHYHLILIFYSIICMVNKLLLYYYYFLF